ncbi:MAG: histidine kinase dimerization/phospho-acceptor domain-containing protein [Bryobacteraceae bacterium]|jgi:signal transduction histidine kinase
MALPDGVEASHRILIVDDNPAIHADIRKVLAGVTDEQADLKDDEALLFGTTKVPMEHFEIDSAYQGQEGLDKIKLALAEGRPYALAFVDVRMPPGWNGVEAIGHFWQADPDLQTVLCTAYSDYSWSDIRRRHGRSASLLVLKKPFDNIEVIQLAYTMTDKCLLSRQAKAQLEDLDRMVGRRTAELQAARIAAESALTAKSEFLVNISHELRTSIDGILGLTRLTLASELAREQRENLKTIESCTVSLLKTVTDIPDLSNFEAGNVELEQKPFSLRKLMEESTKALSGPAHRKGLNQRCEVITGEADAVPGDANRLH